MRLERLVGGTVSRFLRTEAASGVLLLAMATVALVWASSPWAQSYTRLWHTPHAVQMGHFAFDRSLQWLVNDGLMVIFFFVVGLEIRREIHRGELSTWRRATLPAAAALGGMLAPAALYLVVAGAPATRSGWGVPMATDIAFAVGILALLGKRVPPALRVLLLALAIIDDLGAILVIAIFYSSGIALSGFLAAAVGIGALLGLQRLGVRNKLAYVLPALAVWAGIYAAGIHPTIAGVIVGLLTPVRAEAFGDETARDETTSPAEALIESLHPWVAFGIMPVFALANAGVPITGTELDATSWRALLGVVVGLVLGKPLGVLVASFLVLRLRIATLPVGITFRHLAVLGVVAGIGFTMALFIAPLGFSSPELLAAAKLGVLAASCGAGVLAVLLGRFLLPETSAPGAAESAEEAEASTET